MKGARGVKTIQNSMFQVLTSNIYIYICSGPPHELPFGCFFNVLFLLARKLKTMENTVFLQSFMKKEQKVVHGGDLTIYIYIYVYM